MTKADLISEISRSTRVDRIAVSKTIEEMMQLISEQLEKGESVHLRGFGTFGVRDKAQKIARNIAKGEPMLIPAHRQPHFKPSRALLDRVKKLPASGSESK